MTDESSHNTSSTISEQSRPTPPERKKSRRRLIIVLVCVLIIASGIWFWVLAQRDIEDKVKDLWEGVRYKEGPSKNLPEAVGDIKTLLAELPEVPMASEATPLSADDEKRRVSFLDGSFSLIPAADSRKVDLGAGGLATYDSPGDCGLAIVQFSFIEDDPFALIRKSLAWWVGELRVVQKGVVTLDGQKAIILTTRGMIAQTEPSQQMSCVLYNHGKGKAIMLQFSTTPEAFDQDRRIMENVLRTVRIR